MCHWVQRFQPQGPSDSDYEGRPLCAFCTCLCSGVSPRTIDASARVALFSVIASSGFNPKGAQTIEYDVEPCCSSCVHCFRLVMVIKSVCMGCIRCLDILTCHSIWQANMHLFSSNSYSICSFYIVSLEPIHKQKLRSLTKTDSIVMQGTLHLVDAAKKAGRKKFAPMSSSLPSARKTCQSHSIMCCSKTCT